MRREPFLVLGVETSCDETAAAVVESTGRVRSDVVHSQVEVHRPYGGVVPELASRDHLRNGLPVVESALQRAGVGLGDLGGVAVTVRPGLSGALLVGAQLARGIAFARSLPLVGVDHLVGHLAAAHLVYEGLPHEPPPEPPFVALLVSGGHTALYRVEELSVTGVRELGATRDDAAGEAFDKVAKLLGLGYPGGPVVDRLAARGSAEPNPFSRPMPARRSLELSFSGLKTQVARHVERHGRPASEQALADLCAAFQSRVVGALVDKALLAVERERVATLLLAGGVAANRQLREVARERAERLGVRVVVPPARACTDNAAMIAYAGALRLARGENDGLRVTISPHSALVAVTRKGAGPRRASSPGA